LASAANTGSPVEKVVQLIQGILDRTIADGEAEQKIYDKYACWCETTAKRKAAAITDAQDDMRRLGQTILSLKGKIATLTSEIEGLAKDIAQNEADQESATNIRTKENAAYSADTAERKQALAALQAAIEVLIKGTSFAQVEQTNAIKQLVEVLPVSPKVKPQHLALLSEFASGSRSRYAPQSQTIQGILTDMYATFAADLEDATKDEARANREFEDYIYQKQVELANLKETKLKKEGDKAEAENELADTTQAYDDTEAQKEADIAFFDETKDACTAKNEEWVTRKSLRTEEIKGMKEALKILTSDEARELFAKSIKPGKETFFLQMDSEESTSAPVQHAYAVLKAQATKAHSLRLAQLAVTVRNAKSGHFDAVIKSIDAVIQNLKEEEQADVDKRDQCKDTYTEIESTVKDLSWKIKKNEAKIDKLEKLIAMHTEEKLKTIEEIEAVTAQMEAMTKQRNQENEAFLAAKKDDQDAIALLEAARDAISKYYKKNKIEMGPIQGSVKGQFLQKPFDVSEDQAPDATFSHKGSRKNESKGVVQLMSMLIEDLHDEIKNEMKEEEETQLQYEKEMKAAKKLKEELIEKKVNLEETIAKREEDKTDEHKDMGINIQEKMDEVNYKAKIKPDCDWIIGAFKERETARAAEMNGLVTAKEYLAGAKVPSLLQKSKFNDEALSNIKFMAMK